MKTEEKLGYWRQLIETLAHYERLKCINGKPEHNKNQQHKAFPGRFAYMNISGYASERLHCFVNIM